MEISGGINLANYSTDRTKNEVMRDISIAMLDKSLDNEQQMGDQLTKMMERSVNPSVGGNFDISV
ncbi:YjfB family protein [Eubacterium xylanophilum]|uniref:YjfB family protein n=1 Tax=Eubacterium xylanophilum TaxID=39497 RepID=UPI0004BC745C|nr:YjfB family protein [Eubacterium xylanophilum]MCR5797535.1 YjfB family protein [Eubacterium sp.]